MGAAATLVCGGCGQRYARKASRTEGPPATASASAAKFTSQASPASPPERAAPLEPTRSLGGAAADAAGRASFADGAFVANRYRVVRFVARGGMGEVYEAEDLELRGRVALKTIHSAAAEEAGAIERFKREIQLARRVTHPNVCRIFDVGFHELAPGRPPLVFLTMELLEGETLAQRLRRAGKLSPAAALTLARQMADALGAAHRAGVVHRDFKTENVFLVPGSDGERVVVTDFGIARSGDDRFAATLTSDGKVIGTPAYMAPEQIEGAPLTPAADQYAFGVVLFELVTGELPFRGENPIVTAARRLTEAPPSPRDFAPELDPVWEATILRCLARRPEDRFRDVQAAVRALGGETELPALPAAPAAAPRPLPAPGERRKRWLAAALVAVFAASAVYAWWRMREIRDRLTVGAPVAARRAVAVLDPRNLSGRGEAAWLSTALAEMLASELGRGGSLRVVPGESVARALADLGLAHRDALDVEARAKLRRRLGADYLVLGSFTALVDSGSLRIDLRLEDARTSETLATVAENGGEAELFQLVTRAGEALRQALGARGAGAAASALPASPAAAKLYAEGLDALRRFEPQRGRELLEQAVAADPGNALARSALATAWSSLGFRARAEEEARRAVDLAAELAPEERLVVEARYFEASHAWVRAAEVWEKLWTAYPDVVAYGLRLANARSQAGDAERALAVALALRNLPPPEGEDPRIDLAAATAAGALPDYQRQLDAATRAAERAEAEGNELLLAEALALRGGALRAVGRVAEARAALERARSLYAAHGHRSGVSATDTALGGVLLDLGDPTAARAAFDAALAAALELGDRGAEAVALNNLAVLARTRGENAAARASYERVVAIFAETANHHGGAFAATNLAVCLTELGEFDEAARLAENALAVWRESDDRANLPAALGASGGVARRRGDLGAAETAWRQALALRRETGQRLGEAIAVNGLAQTLLEGGRLAEARESFGAAATLARGLSAKSVLASALAGESAVAVELGDDQRARAAASEALALRRELGERVGVERLRLDLARLDVARHAEAARAVAQDLVGSAVPEVAAGARLVVARAATSRRRPRRWRHHRGSKSVSRRRSASSGGRRERSAPRRRATAPRRSPPSPRWAPRPPRRVSSAPSSKRRRSPPSSPVAPPTRASSSAPAAPASRRSCVASRRSAAAEPSAGGAELGSPACRIRPWRRTRPATPRRPRERSSRSCAAACSARTAPCVSSPWQCTNTSLERSPATSCSSVRRAPARRR